MVLKCQVKILRIGKKIFKISFFGKVKLSKMASTTYSKSSEMVCLILELHRGIVKLSLFIRLVLVSAR